jgi:hypothetical protein
VDLKRVFRVVERTVRGLFFEETRRRLDPAYDVRVQSNDTLWGQGFQGHFSRPRRSL